VSEEYEIFIFTIEVNLSLLGIKGLGCIVNDANTLNA
jgi:hypothetical protein